MRVFFACALLAAGCRSPEPMDRPGIPIVDLPDLPLQMLADGAYLVVGTQHGGIYSVSVATRTIAAILARGSSSPFFAPIAATQDAFFQALPDGSIVRIPRSGEPPQVVVVGEGTFRELGAIGSRLYWTTWTPAALRTLGPGAGAPRTVVSSPIGVSLIGLDADAAYCFEQPAGSSLRVLRAPHDGSPPAVVIDSMALGPFSLVDGSIWFTWGTAIRRISKIGGPVEAVAVFPAPLQFIGGGDGVAYAITYENMYPVREDTTSRYVRCETYRIPSAGGFPALRAAGDCPETAAVLAGAFYWTQGATLFGEAP